MKLPQEDFEGKKTLKILTSVTGRSLLKETPGFADLRRRRGAIFRIRPEPHVLQIGPFGRLMLGHQLTTGSGRSCLKRKDTPTLRPDLRTKGAGWRTGS